MLPAGGTSTSPVNARSHLLRPARIL